MKNKLVLPLVLSILLVLLACTISYEGVNWGHDEDVAKLEDATSTANARLEQGLGTPEPEDIGILINQVTEEPASPPVASEPEPADQPAAPADPALEGVPTGAIEYSVTSQNFDCICQETGTVTQELKIEGDKLVLGDQTFDKIGDNSYRRSWMGYYILVSGEGENKTETKVDEERSVVITLTDTGYTMEHFQGASSSPCCIHTFTENK